MAIDVEVLLSDSAVASESVPCQVGIGIISDSGQAQDQDARKILEQCITSEQLDLPTKDIIYSIDVSVVEDINIAFPPLKITDSGSASEIVRQFSYILDFYFKWTDYPAPRSTFLSFYFDSDDHHRAIADYFHATDSILSHPVWEVQDQASASGAINVQKVSTVKSVPDSGVGFDTPNILVDLLQSDTSTTVENVNNLIPKLASDTSTGADSIILSLSAFSVLDAASSTENIVRDKYFTIQDSSVGTDLESKIINLYEQPNITDNFSIDFEIPPSADSGQISSTQFTITATATLAINYQAEETPKVDCYLIIQESVLADDQVSELPVRVVRDYGTAVMWAKQSFFVRDYIHAQDEIVRKIPDQAQGISTIAKVVSDLSSAVTFVPYLEKAVSDLAQSDERLITVVPDSATASERLVKVVKDVGIASEAINKLFVVFDQSQAVETPVKVVPDSSVSQDNVLRVVSDQAHAQDVLNISTIATVSDFAQSDERLITIIPDSGVVSERLVKVVKDSGGSSLETVNKAFTIFDTAQSNELVAKVVLDVGNGVDNNPVRVIHTEYQITDSIIRAVFIKDRGRVRSFNEKLVRVISDQSTSQESDPDILMTVFDSGYIQDDFILDIPPVVITEQCNATDEKQIILTVQDSGTATSQIKDITTHNVITELCYGKFRANFNIQNYLDVSDSGQGVDSHRIIFHLFEAATGSDDISIAFELPTIKDQISYEDLISIQNNVLIQDSAASAEVWTAFIEVLAFEVASLIDELNNFTATVFESDSAVGSDTVDLTQYVAVEQCKGSDLIVKVVSDQSIGSDRDLKNIAKTDSAQASTQLSIETSTIYVQDSAIGNDSVIKVVSDQGTIQENVTIQADVDEDDLAATWHWHVEYTSYTVTAEIGNSKCRHALSVKGFINDDNIHNPIEMGYENGIFGMLYNYEYPMPRFSYIYPGTDITQYVAFERSYNTHFRESDFTQKEDGTHLITEANNCPNDNAYGNQSTTVECYLKVEDTAYGNDTLHVIVEVFDQAQATSAIPYLGMYVFVESFGTSHDTDEDYDWRVNEEIIIERPDILVQDSAVGDDLAIRVVSDAFGTITENIVPPTVDVNIEDQSITSARAFIRMANLYDGDLVITIDPTSYSRRTAILVDFLHHHQYTVLVRDSSKGKTSFTKVKADYKNVGSTSKLITERGIKLRDASGGNDSIGTTKYIDWKLVKETGNVVEDIQMLATGKFVYDEVIYDDSFQIANSTSTTTASSTNHSVSASAHVVVQDQGGIMENVNIEATGVVVGDRVYSSDSDNAPLWETKVEDDVGLGLFKFVSDKAQKGKTTVVPPDVISTLSDEIVGIASLTQGLAPDVVIQDSNSDWGTGFESIKLT